MLTAGLIMEENSQQIMSLTCMEKAQELNALLRSIEQSVETIHNYALDQLYKLEEQYRTDNNVGEYLENVAEVAEIAAMHTDGAVAVYMRFSPELETGQPGMFLVRDNETKLFVDTPPTDISQYDPEDVGHVGWYYIPLANGKATWIEPYYNENIDVEMISYTIPIYINGTAIGVIGMDIDMQVIQRILSNIQIYDTGYAFLLGRQGTVYYHQTYVGGTLPSQNERELSYLMEQIHESEETALLDYKWDGEKRKATYTTLANGMLFTVSAPEKEINAVRNRLALQNLLLFGGVLFVSIFLTMRLTRMMIKPLQHLTETSRKIAEGDYEVDIPIFYEDEVGVLAESFRKMTKNLGIYVDYINKLAYMDGLTRVGNKTAYMDKINSLEAMIAQGNAAFSVFVMDINDLKVINDQYGHEEGDCMLVDAVKLMRTSFGRDAVYRIGGDEFAVIIEQPGEQICREMEQRMEHAMKAFNENCERYNGGVHIAWGRATYDAAEDTCYSDVFCRADKEMYERKVRMKEEHQ